MVSIVILGQWSKLDLRKIFFVESIGYDEGLGKVSSYYAIFKFLVLEIRRMELLFGETGKLGRVYLKGKLRIQFGMFFV